MQTGVLTETCITVPLLLDEVTLMCGMGLNVSPHMQTKATGRLTKLVLCEYSACFGQFTEGLFFFD